MTPAQHCLAEGHEIGNGVIAIADELFSVSARVATPVRLMYFLQVVGYQGLRVYDQPSFAALVECCY